MNPRTFSFIGGDAGSWKVVSNKAVVGEGLSDVAYLNFGLSTTFSSPQTSSSSWILRGVTSNVRYATREEVTELRAKQAGLNRPGALCGVLIPIKKNDAWWALTQDERRAIFEEQSHHTSIGIEYLPAIARQLHHCRDMTESQPFDFLTWFEFHQDDTPHFDSLLARLRKTKEWTFVDREVEIRVINVAAGDSKM